MTLRKIFALVMVAACTSGTHATTLMLDSVLEHPGSSLLIFRVSRNDPGSFFYNGIALVVGNRVVNCCLRYSIYIRNEHGWTFLDGTRAEANFNVYFCSAFKTQDNSFIGFTCDKIRMALGRVDWSKKEIVIDLRVSTLNEDETVKIVNGEPVFVRSVQMKLLKAGNAIRVTHVRENEDTTWEEVNFVFGYEPGT